MGVDMQRFDINKIKRVLKVASETVYYRKVFEEHDIDVESLNTYEEFQKIPITTKSIYRDNMPDFLRESIRRGLNEDALNSQCDDYIKCDEILYNAGLNMAITSGSTGLPLRVIHSNIDDNRNYFILNLYRKKNAKLSFQDKYLWIVPMNEKTKQFFYNPKDTYLVRPNGIEYFLANYRVEKIKELHEIIEKQDIKWITGSPTAIAEYAKYLINNGLSSNLDYIELHSEPLLLWQEDLIRKAFHAQVQCVYSSNEINFIAATCSCGHYHILEENVFVELIRSEEHAAAHKVIVTGLNYYDTPMMRYEIGDLAKEVKCNKQREFAIELLGYRSSDYIMFENGERFEPYVIYDSVFFLNEYLKLNINYYQVVQSNYDNFNYFFEITIDPKQVANCKKFLEDFLYTAFARTVNVTIVAIESIQKDIENKYKRFHSIVK